MLAEWFRAHGFRVDTVSGGEVTEAAFREDIAASFDFEADSFQTNFQNKLGNRKSQETLPEHSRRYLLVNYSRLKLGQKRFSGGHYAPVGAVNYGMDRVLLLEVNQWRYPSVWVNISELWSAIQTQAGNGSWRGYLRLDAPHTSV